MRRLALALLSFILPLSAQKTFVEIPENMVRTEPITENLPRSPIVRSTGKTRPASPPSPPRSKKRQEPSWARMTPPV